MRHAIAVERGTPGYDGCRASALSRRRARSAWRGGRAGLRHLFSPDVWSTSPLLRARRRRTSCSPNTGCTRRASAEALATGDNVQLLEDLEDVDAERVALVGTSRTFGDLSWLLTGDERQGDHDVPERRGGTGIECRRAAAGGCRLEWMMQPGALRLLG